MRTFPVFDMSMERQIASDLMKEVAMQLLSKALHDVTWPYGDRQVEDVDFAQAVIAAASGGEIAVKARIVEVNPDVLLVGGPVEQSELIDRLRRGPTVGYSKLPQLLRDTCDFDMVNRTSFEGFGWTRNAIVHAGQLPEDPVREVLDYVLGTLLPMLDDFWGFNPIPDILDWEITGVKASFFRAHIRAHHIALTPLVETGLSELEARWPE